MVRIVPGRRTRADRAWGRTNQPVRAPERHRRGVSRGLENGFQSEPSQLGRAVSERMMGPTLAWPRPPWPPRGARLLPQQALSRVSWSAAHIRDVWEPRLRRLIDVSRTV